MRYLVEAKPRKRIHLTLDHDAAELVAAALDIVNPEWIEPDNEASARDLALAIYYVIREAKDAR